MTSPSSACVWTGTKLGCAYFPSADRPGSFANVRRRNDTGRQRKLGGEAVAKDAKEMDLDELAQQMHLRPDSMAHLAAHAEFIRRQTEAQLEAAHAQIVAAQAEEMAAKASIATADATKTNARYLLASVIVAAISAVASAVAACYSYWNIIMR